MGSSCLLCAQDNKPRVFITNSYSWEVGGGGGGAGDVWGSGRWRWCSPQTFEIVKTFGQRCPSVVTNNLKDKSDYVVVLDHEGGKTWREHDNKVAVFERVTGDTVVSKSTCHSVVRCKLRVKPLPVIGPKTVAV
jgi:hypothetical protein